MREALVTDELITRPTPSLSLSLSLRLQLLDIIREAAAANMTVG